MIRDSTAQLLDELQQPASSKGHAAALRRLKNQIIGHPQNKEIWIQHGILDILGRILVNYSRTVTHRNSRPPNGSTCNAAQAEAIQLQQDIVLQTIIVVSSLAQGGPRFVDPLAAAQILPVLVSMLDTTSYPSEVVLNVLRALNTVADSTALQHWQNRGSSDWPLRTLYTGQTLNYLVRILARDDPSLKGQQQIYLTTTLISKTCHEEKFRKRVCAAGMLEALAARLVPFVAEYRSQTHSAAPYYSTQHATVLQKPGKLRLAPLLQAVASIVRNSANRSSKFLAAPAFAALELFADPEDFHRDLLPKSRNRYGDYAGETPLPPFVPLASTSSHTYPPLGGMATWGKPRPARVRSTGDGSSAGFTSRTNSNETPLASWLVYVIQTEQGLTRLMAAWLLAIFFRDGLANKDREKALSMQLIPMLVRMLDPDPVILAENTPAFDDAIIQPPQWLMKRLAPHVLALLVGDSKQLQLAASEAGVIKKLSQLLKQTFDTLPADKSESFWSPNRSDQMQSKAASFANSSTLGPPGLTPQASQVLQTRETVLEALANMATQEDELRKAIIQQGVVQHIVASLHPKPPRGSPLSEDSMTKIGNPTPVLMQACAAATALSRSVTALRTCLVDTGLAKPIFALLEYPDIQVQIAATGATCNIVLEMSSMRQEMIEAGVLEVLCKQAHSASLPLRLDSLWALKHLVHELPNELRRSCLEFLGAGWLKQIICNDPEISPRSSSLSMGTPNAAGERVDLLNTDDQTFLSHGSQGLDDDDDDDDEEVLMADDIVGLNQSELQGSISFSGNDAQAQEHEVDRALRNGRDSVLVQAQALDLIRNLIFGSGAADMVDFLFRELGQQTLFDIFTNILRDRPAESLLDRSQRRTGAAASRVGALRHVPPQSDVVIAVIKILVHLAGAGLPRHRQLLLAQTELMQLVVKLSQHPDPEVRSAYAWLGINLTWLDDSSDKLNVRGRVDELRKLGMVERLDVLTNDPNLDVKERARTAMNQINEADP